MDSWQPIETAPKDGTVIDLWDGHYGVRVTNARWDHHYWLNGVPQGEKSWGRDDRDGPFCAKPTHWMPLPTPPNRIHNLEVAIQLALNALGRDKPFEAMDILAAVPIGSARSGGTEHG